MSVTDARPEVLAWRFFDVTVASVHRLSPSFVRLTLTGPDLDEFADNGSDQRFKLVLPVPGQGYADLPRGPDWYADWRQLPEERRNPVRTYTVRAVRPLLREVDVDLVLHGSTGPASAYAAGARVGDDLVVLGPNALSSGAHGGLEFSPPPGHGGPLLLAGDETALPALASVVESLPASAFGELVVEVPSTGDRLDLAAPPGLRVSWVVRDRSSYGERLVPAVQEAFARLGVGAGPALGSEIEPALGSGAEPAVGSGVEPEFEVGEELVWDVPADVPGESEIYAWLAGESSVIIALRRWLVREQDVDRRAVAFMGYWKLGRPSG